MKKNYTSLTAPVLLGTIGMLVAAPVLAESKPTANNKPSADAKSDAIEVPRSEFAIPSKAGDGRDPFFPLSRRLIVEAKPKNDGAPKPVSVSLLLKGIANSGNKRFALINDKTFEAGEERDVPFGSSKVRVLCVEIGEDSAIVEVNGSRQELRLKPGL